jgi:hypothetical protein
VEATMALSHQEGVTDSARARELYKLVFVELTELSQCATRSLPRY